MFFLEVEANQDFAVAPGDGVQDAHGEVHVLALDGRTFGVGAVVADHVGVDAGAPPASCTGPPI